MHNSNDDKKKTTTENELTKDMKQREKIAAFSHAHAHFRRAILSRFSFSIDSVVVILDANVNYVINDTLS